MIENLKVRTHDEAAPLIAYVVDDDVEACSELADYLRGKGFSVVEYHEGIGAIKALRRHKPQLVFMDVRMPLMDGIRATQGILSLRPETTVVLMSGYPVEIVRAMHAKEADLAALTVIQKPIHLQELAAIVSGVLRRSASSRRERRAR